jgi:hypothetical protein
MRDMPQYTYVKDINHIYMTVLKLSKILFFDEIVLHWGIFENKSIKPEEGEGKRK